LIDLNYKILILILLLLLLLLYTLSCDDDGWNIDGTGETATPMSPSTPDQFKCSFTVKYICRTLTLSFLPFSIPSLCVPKSIAIGIQGHTTSCRLNSELRRGMVTQNFPPAAPSLLPFPYLTGCKFLLFRLHSSKSYPGLILM
jgi:hypothetical protein